MSSPATSAIRGRALIAALLGCSPCSRRAACSPGGELRATPTLAHAREASRCSPPTRAALIGCRSATPRPAPEGYGFPACPDAGNTGPTPIGAVRCAAPPRSGACLAHPRPARAALTAGRNACGNVRGRRQRQGTTQAGGVELGQPGPVRPARSRRAQLGSVRRRHGGGDRVPPGPPRSSQIRPPTGATSCTGSDSAAADLSHYSTRPCARRQRGSRSPSTRPPSTTGAQRPRHRIGDRRRVFRRTASAPRPRQPSRCAPRPQRERVCRPAAASRTEWLRTPRPPARHRSR